jgi:multiple sugar transport system ATP-binding protein
VAGIELAQVWKVFADGTQAVRSLDLDVRDGEFVVLVGPSGCGKTTALRMVAGLEDVTAGTVRIGGRPVNDVPPRARDVAMVFQNYALYPHLTVEANIGFGLKLRKVDKREIRQRVVRVARLLGIEELLDRRPRALSGGQRQRVAMGRAIVREPAAFLMDEPLSNLDAKLRVQTRAEILRLQKALGVTTLYVTHDQVEAMTMGDRVAVMRQGLLQQVASPAVLYDRPVNLFVAGFIGSPAMNFVPARLVVDADRAEVRFGRFRLTVDDASLDRRPELRARVGSEVIMGVRPEDLEDAGLRAQEPGNCIEVEADLVEKLGSDILVHFRLDVPPIEATGAAGLAEAIEADTPAVLDQRPELVARVNPRSVIAEGGTARLSVDVDRSHFFDPSTGSTISHPVEAVRPDRPPAADRPAPGDQPAPGEATREGVSP